VLTTTKVTALVIIPVLGAAFVILFFFPGQTERLWAWTIHPDMTPITMGAGYLGGAWFFTRVATNKHPDRVVGGLGAASVFTLLLGLATFLHWDKFNHTHISFWAWLFLYVVSPVLLPILAVANWRAAAAGTADTAAGPEIPAWARIFLGFCGGMSVLAAVTWFVVPRIAIEHAPWKLTPLTARTICAFVGFTGLFLMTPLLDRRWTSVRIGIEAVTVGLVLTGLGALKARHDFTGPDSSVIGFGVALALLLAVLVFLQLQLSRATPAGSPPPEPPGG